MADRPLGAHNQYRRKWRSRHSNGWEAWIGENEYGDFHVWTCVSGAPAVPLDAVEDTETRSKNAALLALQRHTGHRCEAGCSGWELIDTNA